MAVRAIRPPAASCQARVGREKNATGAMVWVVISDAVNEAAATSANATRYGVVDADEVVSVLARRRVRAISQAVAMISGGHTR